MGGNSSLTLRPKGLRICRALCEMAMPFPFGGLCLGNVGTALSFGGLLLVGRFISIFVFALSVLLSYLLVGSAFRAFSWLLRFDACALGTVRVGFGLLMFGTFHTWFN